MEGMMEGMIVPSIRKAPLRLSLCQGSVIVIFAAFLLGAMGLRQDSGWCKGETCKLSTVPAPLFHPFLR
jgi:hypothetical protein